MIKIIARPEPVKQFIWLSPILAIALTLISGGLLFWFLGQAPLPTLKAFFIDPLTSLYGLSELGVKATPIILCAIGLAFGFRAQVWNIGAEGQYIFGAIFAGGLTLFVLPDEGWYVLPVMMIGGIVGGALWGAIPALLKDKFNTNEILVSLMLTYVAVLVLSLLVHGAWRDPDGFNFPETKLFAEGALLPALLSEGRLHSGALFALLAVFISWLFVSRHIIGFQIKVIGLAPKAARYAGIKQSRMIWFSFLLSGGLAGLAGATEVSGTIGQLVPIISPGYGFTAIIVAFVGRLHPFGILGAGLLLGLTYLGGENVQITAGLPQAVTGVFQGMLLFWLLMCDLFIRYRVVFSYFLKATP